MASRENRDTSPWFGIPGLQRPRWARCWYSEDPNRAEARERARVLRAMEYEDRGRDPNSFVSRQLQK